jgi:class 3 adenylate cyclase/TolB-like protein/Flp pilus assembly protein TadD
VWGGGGVVIRQPLSVVSLKIDENILKYGSATRSVLMVDLVESVRLIQENELETIQRWISFVDHIEEEIIPFCSGRLKKRLGDGLLIDFVEPRDACTAALRIQERCVADNRERGPSDQFILRMGIDVAQVFEDERDLYGHGVNRAARLMAIGRPGDILISSDARALAVADLDARFEDLGDCYLKHVTEPVRTYRVFLPGESTTISPAPAMLTLNPTLAVMPFSPRKFYSDHVIIGEIISDELIHLFSASPNINVISHLSTSAFRGRKLNLSEIEKHLKANFVLSGRFASDGDQIDLFVELADTNTGMIVWSDRIQDRLTGLYSLDSALVSEIVSSTCNAITVAELKRARSLPLPNLQTHSLLVAAIALMHRMSRPDFQRSFEMLEEVVQRAGRQSTPHAWMAKWYVLKAQQGWSEQAGFDAHQARTSAARALDADPDSSLALMIDGLVHTHMLKDHETARKRYRSAVEANPNNALAWLLKGVDHAFTGDGGTAVNDTQKAIRLSPLDPHRYYYDTLAATAFLANHQFEQALEHANRSLQANRLHTSSLRAKSIACWKLGRRDQARLVGKELMDMEPNLTIEAWKARTPSIGHAICEEWADTLKKVGVPE